jgi:hypothetical protein
MPKKKKKVLRRAPRVDYQFYVYSPRANKIYSAWEYRADAEDSLKELHEDMLIYYERNRLPVERFDYKVYTLTGLRRLGVEPIPHPRYREGGR